MLSSRRFGLVYHLHTSHIIAKLNRLSSLQPAQTIVCKHWLRGLCKKGDQCEFLHEYDMSKMPECYFYTRFSEFYTSLIK